MDTYKILGAWLGSLAAFSKRYVKRCASTTGQRGKACHAGEEEKRRGGEVEGGEVTGERRRGGGRRSDGGEEARWQSVGDLSRLTRLIMSCYYIATESTLTTAVATMLVMFLLPQLVILTLRKILRRSKSPKET